MVNQSVPGFGLSILASNEMIRTFGKFKHVFVFTEGISVLEDLILYETASDHYSLEPALPSPTNRISGPTGLSLISCCTLVAAQKFFNRHAVEGRLKLRHLEILGL